MQFLFSLHASVIVDDLNFVGIPVTPNQARTPLIVNPDAVLPLAFAAQGFQTVTPEALPNRAIAWSCPIAEVCAARWAR